MCPVAPVFCQPSAYPYTVRQCGRSAGMARHWMPSLTRYRIPSTMSRRQYSPGWPPFPSVQAGGGSAGSVTAHSAPVMSEG